MKELNTPTTDELYSKIESLTDEIVELRKTGLNAIKIAEDLSYLKKKYETRVEQLQSSLKAAESVNEVNKHLDKFAKLIMERLEFNRSGGLRTDFREIPEILETYKTTIQNPK